VVEVPYKMTSLSSFNVMTKLLPDDIFQVDLPGISGYHIILGYASMLDTRRDILDLILEAGFALLTLEDHKTCGQCRRQITLESTYNSDGFPSQGWPKNPVTAAYDAMFTYNHLMCLQCWFMQKDVISASYQKGSSS
jgi:hypothetical protein